MPAEPGGEPARDLGGLVIGVAGRTEPGRVFRASVRAVLVWPGAPERFGTVIDLRSVDECDLLTHPLAGAAGYLHLPLIDPSAEAQRVPLEGETLGDIYRSSLRRNARNIAAIMSAAARGPLPLLITCTAGKDRTGMICALLLDFAGVLRSEIEADYAATESSDPIAIRQMLNHMDDEYGSVEGYARFLELDENVTASLVRLLR